MLQGQFDIPSGRPILEGIVQFPRLGLVKAVKFLVDTGCDSTTLMPDDALKLGIPWDDLTAGGTAMGIGGHVEEFVELGVVSFPERDGRIHTYRFEISIMPPLPSLQGLPSLLGRDILNRWRMVHDPAISELTFEVRSADRTLAARG